MSILCVVQFAWTLVHERAVLTAWSTGAAVLGVVLFLLIFQELHAESARAGHIDCPSRLSLGVDTLSRECRIAAECRLGSPLL